MNGAVPQQPERPHIVDRPWAVILSVIGLMSLGVAYSLGDAYYGAYLQAFSIDDSGFPIDRAKHLILAVWGALNASIALQNWIASAWKALFLSAVAVIAYICLLYGAGKVLSLLRPRITQRVGPVAKVVRIGPTIRKCIGAIIVVFLVTIGLIWFCIFLPPFISIPSGIGAAIGEQIAKERKADFSKGCLQSRAKCYAAVRDGKEIGRGYEVAQSATRVALYYQGRTVQLPLDGVHLETVAQPLK